MPTFIKGWCTHCRGLIEIPVDRRSNLVVCPNCGRDVAASTAIEYRLSSGRTRRLIRVTLLLVFIIALGTVGYIYRTRVTTGFDLAVAATGSPEKAAAALAGGFLVLLWLLVWMIFPIVMYMGLKDLRRRAQDLEESSRLCLRHLARISGERNASRIVPSTEPGPATPPPGPTEESR